MSEKAFERVFDDLMNDIMLEFAFQAHRAYKAGFFETKEKKETEDIYGLVKGKGKMPIILCPKCGNRKFEPSRMASHLSDCMVGKGRTSSRKATKKLNSINDESDDCDYENDDLSFPSSSKKKTKKKPGQANSRKRNNPNKISLDQFCGAMTKNSKKQCMNSKNCHQHSEQQVQSIPVTHPIEPKKEDVQIDVDTVDEENDVYVSQIFSTSTSFEMHKKFSE